MKRKAHSLESSQQDSTHNESHQDPLSSSKRRKLTDKFELFSYGDFIAQLSLVESQSQFHIAIKLHIQFLTSSQNPILHYQSYSALKSLLKEYGSEEMLSCYPESDTEFVTLVVRAWILSDALGRHEDSINTLNMALHVLESLGGNELNAAKAFSLFSRGRLVSDNNQKRDDFVKSVDLFPMVFCLNNRAYMWMQLSSEKENLNRAYEDYSFAIRLYPTYAVAYQNRADLLVAMGDHEAAQRDYQMSMKMYSF